MAKKHVNMYFLEVQNNYFEMLDNLKEFKQLAEEGKIAQEDYDQMLAEVELEKSNYERIAYIIMLLNKPNKSSNEEADINRAWYKELQGASKEVIIKESADVLADLKALIKKGKESNE